MSLIIPKDFKISKRAPLMVELEWLYTWLTDNPKEYCHDKVLEFGCGITSWVLNQAVKPKTHVAMEAFEPCINTVKQHIPSIQIVKTTWNDIPKMKYDIVLVDSSTNPPSNVEPIDPKRKALFRDDAIKYVESFADPKAIYIIHDWNHHQESWRAPRRYLENNGYTLIGSIASWRGFGIYRSSK